MTDAERRELEKKYNAAVANGYILRAQAIGRRLDDKGESHYALHMTRVAVTHPNTP